MAGSVTRLRWASGIMVALGAGHLALIGTLAWTDFAGWVDRGVWAAVPLLDETRNGLAFWAGPGSFGVPLVLLGCLTWHLAGRGTPPPAWLGWAVAVWCAVGGLLLMPSPFVAGVVAGALIVAAAREVTPRPGPPRA